MAGGQLVPHTLPNGQTVMVPDYLVPQPQALALPPMQPPSVAPDQRLAYNGTDLGGAPDPSVFAADDAQAAQAKSAEAFRSKLAAPAPAEHTSPAKEPGWMPTGQGVPGGKKPTSGVDPASLVKASRPAAQVGGQEGDIDPDVGAYLLSKLKRGGGGGPSRPGGLVQSAAKEEVRPAENLLPEYKWELGLERRPDLGQEVDPNAEQPTWGDENPVMRQRKTALEQGADVTGQYAEKSFQQSELARQAQSVVAKNALVQQSTALDDQLGTIAKRRAQLAQLHDLADQRSQEAASIEPRTRAEVWGSKGNLGRGLAVLSAVLGGLAGNNNGWNMVKQSVDDAVDDDKTKWERASRLNISAHNDFERAMTLYGDPEMAELDVRNRKLVNMATMAEQQANDRSLDATAKERAMMVVGQARQAFFQGKQQLADLASDKVLKREVDYKAAPAGGGGGDPVLKAYEDAAKLKAAKDKVMGAGGGTKNAVILTDGSTAYATSPAEAQSAQGVIRSADEASDMLDRLDALTETAGKRVLTADERGQAETLQAELMPALQGVHGFKRLTDADLHLLKEMTGDPAAFARNPNARAKLHELKRGVQGTIQNRLKYLRRKPMNRGGTETAAPPAAEGFQEEGEE
jgi:hypothetical protein